jgi:hypothetical protein
MAINNDIKKLSNKLFTLLKVNFIDDRDGNVTDFLLNNR